MDKVWGGAWEPRALCQGTGEAGVERLEMWGLDGGLW